MLPKARCAKRSRSMKAVPGCRPHGFNRWVITEPMLDVPILVALADIGDRFRASAKSPSTGAARGRSHLQIGVLIEGRSDSDAFCNRAVEQAHNLLI
jgi:hypothetical protein